MTTLTRTRSAVKPSLRKARPAAPFGAGILTPARPAAELIPADVARIRVVDGPRAGAYARAAGMPGWADHWRSEADGSAWLAEADADALYTAGRVAILADAPAPTPGPADEDEDGPPWPAEFAPELDLPWIALAPEPGAVAPAPRARRMPYTAADVAWEAGHSAGLADGEPTVPAGLTGAEGAAWLAGFDQGWATFRDREDAELVELALEAEWAELAEARVANPGGEWRD